MNKHLSFLIVFLAVIIFISSCSELKSKYYVGEKEKIPTKDVEQETIWQYEDDVFYVRVVDSLTVVASSLEWDGSAKQYKIHTFDAVFTKLGEVGFLNLKGADSLYIILRMVVSDYDGTIAFFTVDDKFMDKEMKKNKVKVEKDGSSYILDIEKDKLDAYVSENLNELFKIKSPGIVRPLVDITTTK